MEMELSKYSPILTQFYKFKNFRRPCLLYLQKFEGGPLFSITLRKILSQYHGVTVGNYSYGACMKPGFWPSGVVVGRFVSIGDSVKVFLRNHPSERLSMHPFFYNHKLQFVTNDTINTGTLEIGHDSWIGSSSIILPGCKKIGIGALVGAGAIVTHDVPNFAVVAGNPARIIRYRFNEAQQQRILDSKWWANSITDLKTIIPYLINPIFLSDSTIFQILKQN
jgi:virginiamycin A acetyltransferase